VDVMVLARDDADTATIAERLVALGLQHARGSRPERPFLLGGVDRDGATTYIHIHVIDLHLPGPPVSVVADDDNAIQAAVGRMWPASSGPAPYLFLCEHHLRERAKAALTRDNAHAGRGRWMTRLDTAFRRPEGWEEFADACGELADAKAWASTNDTRISAQVAARDRLPAHYSTAAVDAAAQQLRGMFEHRSFALRNARRTNLLLGLAQLHLNNTDDPDTYHRILREHAERAGGQPAAPQRRNRDHRDSASIKRTRSPR